MMGPAPGRLGIALNEVVTVQRAFPQFSSVGIENFRCSMFGHH
jgi:hypothetical protein